MIYEKPTMEIAGIDETDIITLSAGTGGSGPDIDGNGQWSS